MRCSYAKLPDGSTAILCGSKPRVPRCKFCHGTRPATQLCDFVVSRTLGGGEITCDTRVCVYCARREGDKDFCPRHS